MKNKTTHIITKTISSTKALMLGSFLLVGALHTVEAQSISNPSFETLTTAGSYPSGASQMGLAASWTQPTVGTCDYFYGTPNPSDYRMAISTTGSAPYNPISAQNGAAYVGGYMEEGGYASKEYITNRLSAKLTAGVTYSITFYTLHLYGTSNTSGFGSINWTDFPNAEKGFLGLCFSAVSPTSANTAPSGGNPGTGPILNSWNTAKRTLVPTSNTDVYGTASRNTWVPVTLTYTADGTEEYMTVGSFREGTSTLTSGSAVYYLFDNFSPTLTPLVASLSKSIAPATIQQGGTATYTFTVTNTQAGSAALSGLSFTDTLPSGLRIASTPNVVVTGLTGGTTTAAAGGTSIAASGYSIAANTTATITVNVTNAAGQLNANCGSNPAAFTNGSSNISGLSANLTNNVGNVCLVVTPPCAAGTTAPVLSSN